MTLGQLTPEMRVQVERKLAKLRMVSKVRDVIVPGNDDEAVLNWKRTPRKRGSAPLLPKLSQDPTERLAFYLRVDDLVGFEREYRFHPERKWRIDIAYVAEKLAIEIEGVTAAGGRHQRIAGFRNDMKKYNELALAGWRLLRFMPEMVSSGHAAYTIRRALGKTKEGNLACKIADGDLRREERHGRRTGRARAT